MRPHGAAVEITAWLLWLTCVAADGPPRFAVMDAVPALEARWYPPLVVDAVPANLLVKRQDVLSCDAGFHNCLDVGSGGSCCENSKWCFINKQGAAKCCGAGSSCSESMNCPTSQFQCNDTRTVTTTAPGGSTSVSTETFPACCGRKCATSSFRCPSSMGDGCCGYGSTCASGSKCIAARSQTPTGFVPQVPEGCTTSQISCPSSVGGGCCPVGRSCTRIGSVVACATVPALPTDGSITIDQNGGSDGGMSTGAKAGIAIGVVLGAAVVIGIATWLCIRNRRRRRGTASYVSQDVSQIHDGGSGVGSGYGPRSRASIPMIAGGGSTIGGGGGAGVGSDRGGALSGTASEVRYPTADYFGPDAVAGPYTDVDSPTAQREATPGFDRGVPSHPDGPSHIVAPVELDSGRSVSGKSDVTNLSNMDARALSMYSQTPAAPDDVGSRFELYGSETPAQLHSDEAPRRREQPR
ncbi:hypothetical protein RB594_002192 [Gaeumannomyces avenae]